MACDLGCLLFRNAIKVVNQKILEMNYGEVIGLGNTKCFLAPKGLVFCLTICLDVSVCLVCLPF